MNKSFMQGFLDEFDKISSLKGFAKATGNPLKPIKTVAQKAAPHKISANIGANPRRGITSPDGMK